MNEGTTLPRELRSPRAFTRYRELVEERNRTPIMVATDFRLTEAELTWCDLTEIEAEVFGIDPLLLNALVLAFTRFSDFMGFGEGEFKTFRDEERAAYPEFFKGERVYSIDDAIGFMAIACGLPQTQASLWVCRAHVQYVRSGLIADDHRAPDWAFGALAVATCCGEEDSPQRCPTQ